MASVIVIFEAGSFPAPRKKKKKLIFRKKKKIVELSASAMGVPITPHPIKSV